MREGKNREIRNVLGALGLQVNRLIRVSYGPFQLGDLPSGAVEEVKTRALRDQIGERLAAVAGADFSGPLVEREVAEPRAPRVPRPSEERGEQHRASKGDGPRAARKGKPSGGGRPSPDQVRGRPFEGRPRRASQDDGERRNPSGKGRPHRRPDNNRRGR
jgi:23S rRNA pseudouridine2605 synthase